MTLRVVFDSSTFFSAWVQDLNTFPEEHQAITHLKEYCHHRLCFNKNIEKEYEKYFHSKGFLSTIIKIAIEELRLVNKITVVPSKPRKPIKGLRSAHKMLIESAVAGQAKYIVTKYDQWRTESEEWQNLYGVTVLTPAAYCKTE